jgi:hypothetical protein
MIMIAEACKSPAAFHAQLKPMLKMVSPANISLSIWKIVQRRRGIPALFSSPLLDTVWKDGSFVHLVSFFWANLMLADM